MNKEELAKLLNGRQHRDEIDKDLCEKAKENNLVVVFGSSNDLMEFRGAVYDEVGCYEGGEAYINKNGLLENPNECEDCEDCKYFQKEKKQYKKIEAIWDKDGYSFVYETDILHATFEIFDEEDKYCRGIVFSLDDINI